MHTQTRRATSVVFALLLAQLGCGSGEEGHLPIYEAGDGTGEAGGGGAVGDGAQLADGAVAWVDGQSVGKDGAGLTLKDGAGGKDGAGVPGDGGSGSLDAGSGGGGWDANFQGLPQMEVKLDGSVKTVVVWEYWVDPQTQPEVIKAKVQIGNTGDQPLHIHKLIFQSETPQIALTWYETPLTSADYPYPIEPFTTLDLSVEFTVKPKLKTSKTATLRILSDDPQQPDLVLSFATPCTGAKPVIEPSAFQFINAGPFKPRTACFQVGNLGCQQWLYAKTTFEPANAAYSVWEEPPVADKIQSIGEPGNPWTKPKKLQVCARFQPAKQGDPTPVKMTVYGAEIPGGPADVAASVSLSGVWQPPSSYSLKCGGPAGFDFGVGGPGKKVCTLINLGPAGMTLHKLALEPTSDLAKMSDIQAAFQAQMVIPGKKDALTLPFTLAAGQGAQIAVSFTGTPANPPPAQLTLGYTQAGESDTVHLPLHAGACDENALVASPLPMGFHVTGSPLTTLTIANQSCAPLKVMKHCTTLYNVTQFSACETGAPSTEYKVTNSMPDLLLPWSLASVDISFKPGPGTYKEHYGQLHLFYCPGVWDGGKCSLAMTRIEVPLEGNAQSAIQPVVLSIAPPSGAKAGQAVRLVANVQLGTHPIGDFGAYQWMVRARPAGSRAWIAGAPTDGNELVFVPDLPGQYTLGVTASSFVPGKLDSQSWSKVAEVSFTAAP